MILLFFGNKTVVDVASTHASAGVPSTAKGAGSGQGGPAVGRGEATIAAAWDDISIPARLPVAAVSTRAESTTKCSHLQQGAPLDFYNSARA